MCRASALPARFVTTVPIGSTAAVVPHPWIEVLIEDAWLALDPTRRVPRAALLRLGTRTRRIGRAAGALLAACDRTPPASGATGTCSPASGGASGTMPGSVTPGSAGTHVPGDASGATGTGAMSGTPTGDAAKGDAAKGDAAKR
jgi:hypothetical protein